jgi:Hemerythrin HHE cation binding domain
MQAVPRAVGGPRRAWRHHDGRSSFLLATPDRVAALSEQLTHVHQALREQLTSLRREAASGAAPRAVDAAAGEDLLSHCLSFCAAVPDHHTGEDTQLLPALRAAAPGLAPVIDNLIEDHGLVAAILRKIRELLAPGQSPSVPGALVRELDGLTAILESHFRYEERRIAKELDNLGPAAWTADAFTPGQGPAG